MSVCTFSTEELANVAAVICNMREVFKPNDQAARWCDNLALISEANIACFNDKYRLKGGEASRSSTAKEIACAMGKLRRSASEPYRANVGEAYRCVTMFHYNCDDEGGDFTLKIEGASTALVLTLAAMVRVLAQKAGIDE